MVFVALIRIVYYKNITDIIIIIIISRRGGKLNVLRQNAKTLLIIFLHHDETCTVIIKYRIYGRLQSIPKTRPASSTPRAPRAGLRPRIIARMGTTRRIIFYYFLDCPFSIYDRKRSLFPRFTIYFFNSSGHVIPGDNFQMSRYFFTDFRFVAIRKRKRVFFFYHFVRISSIPWSSLRPWMLRHDQLDKHTKLIPNDLNFTNLQR